jgi:signal transduction histidine kinase
LTQSLEELVERISGSCPVRFAARIDYIDDLCPKDSAINLYRIVQEGINNVVKHSGATGAKLLISRSPREVEMLIEDDGRGFNLSGDAARRPGFGLTGLAERARILGGTLSVDSAPGKGTVLKLRIPVRDGHHEA